MYWIQRTIKVSYYRQDIGPGIIDRADYCIIDDYFDLRE